MSGTSPWIWLKKLMVFRPAFGLTNDYGEILKGVSTRYLGFEGGAALSPPTQIVVSVTPPTHSGGSWSIYLGVKPEIMGVAGANMQCCHFVCPSSSQKRKSTAFDLILRSTWGLLSPGKQVGRSSTPYRKRSQLWGRQSEWWPKYLQ